MLEKRGVNGNVVSTDESVGVNRTGDTFDLSVSKTTVSSEDGTVKIIRDDNNYDLSVQLVTEERDGLARAFDKKIHDHSFANVAYMGQAQKAGDAVEDYLMSEDEQYVPEYGQIVGWEDQEGRLRLSRMNSPSLRLPLSSYWVDGVYDEQHETVCVVSSGDPSANGYDGDFCVAVRKMTTGWKVVRVVSHEKWMSVCYGNGYLIVTSGNESREFMYSTDGGYSWTQSANLTLSHWLRAKYNPADGYFYFIASERVVKSQDLQTFTQVYLSPSGSTLNDICFVGNSLGYMTYINGECSFKVGNTVAWHTTNFRMIECDYVNGYLVCWNEYSIWITKDYPNDRNLRFHDVLYSVGQYYEDVKAIATTGGINVFLSGSDANSTSERIVRKIEVVGENVTVDTRKTYPTDTNTTHLFMCENEGESALFLFGGASFMAGTPFGAKKSDWAKMLKTDLSEFPPLSWEEIPVLDDKADGLLCANNGEFAECDVEKPYIKYANGNLSVNHSDRFTEYANYRLVEKTTSDNAAVLWCIPDLSEIVDNSTYVYDDEECTNSVGIITNHSYNPNNPNDVEVMVDGVTYTYEFQASKTPISLATTAALIAAVEELKKKVSVAETIWYIHNGVPSKVQNITYNSNTGFFERTISNNVNDQIVAVIDDQYPAADYSNMLILYTCVQVSGSFTTNIACMYTDGNITAPLIMTV